MNKFKNLLLYLSAFIPMYILLLIKLIIELICKHIDFNVLSILFMVSLTICISFGICGILINTRFSNGKVISIFLIRKKNITDIHFLGYFSLFVLFALQLNLSLVSSFVSYILIISLIGIVYTNNSLYYINPFLNILGYNFYDIEYKEIGQNKILRAKVFCKDSLFENQSYTIVLKNKHFSFIKK